MKREDDEKLWDLLGRSAKPEVSPFFARNVLREVRETESRSRVGGWLQWLVPAAGVAVAIIAALFLRVQTPDQNYDSRTETLSFIESQDSELIADLDDLIESDDNNSWDESVLL
ncbi:MAG TPA: hypothetical protein VEX43_02300 [Chthoniobacterales bacterium]|nr:hypothetical protein [Chthoniobacterales bacterium]